jgi:DNA primase
MPLDWSELDAIESGDHFTLHNVHRGLQTPGVEPWRDIQRAGQPPPPQKATASRKTK